MKKRNSTEPPCASTIAMRARVRELATPPRDDFDRAVLATLDDFAELERQVYVPGLWRCPKCEFQLVQSNLYMPSGTVGPRDQPGDKCPNCDSPLWRVTERQAGNDMVDRCQEQMERAKMLDGIVEKLTLALMEIRCQNGDPVQIARKALGLTESPGDGGMNGH